MALQIDARYHTKEQFRFDRLGLGATIGLVRRWSTGFSVRSVLASNSVRYHNAESGNRTSFEALLGANIALGNRNTLDVTINGGTHVYNFLDREFLLIDPNDPTKSLIRGSAPFFGASLRWSRPITARTGVAITLRAETLTGTQNRLLFGASTGYLTPWDELIDRAVSSLQFKSFMIPKVESVLFFSNERRWFHSAVENSKILPIKSSSRRDDGIRVNLTLMIPVLVSKTLLGRVTLATSYFNSKSNISQYSFKSWDGGILFELEF